MARHPLLCHLRQEWKAANKSRQGSCPQSMPAVFRSLFEAAPTQPVIRNCQNSFPFSSRPFLVPDTDEIPVVKRDDGKETIICKAATLRQNDLKMYYEVHGSGRPLLLLHGGVWNRGRMDAPFFHAYPEPSGDRGGDAGTRAHG